MDDFLNILEKAAAEEAQAHRLNAAMILLAPDEDKAQLLEIFKDESDHAVKIQDMLVRYTTGEPGTVAEQTGEVD